MSAAPVLEVRGLGKSFGSVHAVRDVSFGLRRGEVVALVGESGSGKSTVARLIARLVPATSGEIRLAGQDVLRAEPRGASFAYRRRVQMIFQDPFASLNPARTVGHHLERPLLRHGKVRSRAALRARVGELLAAVGLGHAAAATDLAGRRPDQLSGGQRQRVAIARALAVEPEVILADEPTSMLDLSLRMGILDLVTRLAAERGVAFLFITHDLASARHIADRILVMYRGAIVEGGDTETVLAHPVHAYTQRLIAAVPDPYRAMT